MDDTARTGFFLREEEPVEKDKLEDESEIEEKEDPKKEPPKKMASSIWELLMQSKVHMDAMVQVLHERKLSTSTTLKQLVSFLMQKPEGAIIFTDEDLEGRDHYWALFIKAEIKGKMTYCMMVDDRSVINVCPLKILPRLGLIAIDL